MPSARAAWTLASLVALGAMAPGDARLHRPHTPLLRAGRQGHDAVDGIDTPRPTRTRCQGARDTEALPDILAFNLRSAPFPSTEHPDVAVHVPEGFDGTLDPGVIVFFHGWENCVVNVLGNVDAACTPDGPVRDALHLAEQLDAARANAILVAVEGRFDVAAGDPGQLLVPGSFRELLHELLVEHLDDPLGCELDVDDLDRVVVASHSGGYQSVSAVLKVGQVPIAEVVLLDSLYGEIGVFNDWIATSPARFDPLRDDALRWVNVYTCCGGTSDNSRAMAGGVWNALVAAGRDDAVYQDDTTATIAPLDLARPIVFKLTDLPHADVPKNWFRPLVEASGFAMLP
jgi:hypothetical protein